MPSMRFFAPARARRCSWLFASLLALVLASPAVPAEVVVGSKNFTEGIVLGELIRGTAASADEDVEHLKGLGGTRLVFNALVSGEIDVYAEYTGTLTHEIFADDKPETLEELRARLADLGLVMSEPLGFRDNFALGMRKDVAEQAGVSVTVVSYVVNNGPRPVAPATRANARRSCSVPVLRSPLRSWRHPPRLLHSWTRQTRQRKPRERTTCRTE